MTLITPNTYAIEAHGLKKSFKSHGRTVEALRGVSFCVERGTVFSILGPNGAGKTTLLRILNTTLAPDGGSATIEGFDIAKTSLDVRNSIGVVAQTSNFDRYLTLWQNLVLHARMHGLNKPDYEARISELLERVNLYQRRNDYADEFSGGMQRRAALIRALIHQPKVLFLDEPSTGLDPQARREIWQTIEQLKATTTVILTTHYMDEADVLSDRIMMVNHGEVVMEGSPSELKRKLVPDNAYDLVLKSPRATHYAKTLTKHCKQIEHISDFQLRVHIKSPHELKPIMAELDLNDFERLGTTDTDLETVYLSVTDSAEASPKKERSNA